MAESPTRAPRSAPADVPVPGPSIGAIVQAWPPRERAPLLAVRALVYRVAAADDALGEILESVKWGQPSYRSTDRHRGTALRLGIDRRSGRAGVYFHCGTAMIVRCRERFPDAFAFDGNRGLLLDSNVPEAEATAMQGALAECVREALTYRPDGVARYTSISTRPNGFEQHARM